MATCTYHAMNPDEVSRFGYGTCSRDTLAGSTYCAQHWDYWAKIRAAHLAPRNEENYHQIWLNGLEPDRYERACTTLAWFQDTYVPPGIDL